MKYKGLYNEGKSKYGLAYTREELRSMLPKVGEHRVENSASSDVIQLTGRKPGLCTVVGVNEDHFWYRVRFDATGVCQCFKLPRLE